MSGLLPLRPGSVREVGDEAAGRGPERNANGRPQCTDCVRTVHYLREAATPVYQADRHAKVQLKKEVRGIRPVEGRDDAEARDIRGSCAAVRSALTDDGRPPLEASGLKLVDRLTAVAASLDRVAAKRGWTPPGCGVATGGCLAPWRVTSGPRAGWPK